MTFLTILKPFLQASNPFGAVSPPPGVGAFNAQIGGENPIGILLFFRSMFTVVTVIAGIWTLYNIMLAGLKYITSQGNSSAHQEVRDKITMSILGLILIVSAYTIVGVLGLILFGSPTYFLQPTLQGPN